MIEQDELFSGLQCYEKHEYLLALKHFNKGANRQDSQVSQMIYQSLQAVTNMQLCNYNLAAEQLNQLKNRLQNWEMHPSEAHRTPEVELLRVKVLANLLIIHLINCNPQVASILGELVYMLQDRYSKNTLAGVSLLRALLKSLFSFQSFHEMQNELVDALVRADRLQHSKARQSREGSALLPSPIFLSSLSIYSHLAGNASGAMKLQKLAYEMNKNDDPIAAVISLRHLEEIQKQLEHEKQRRNYHQELVILMGNHELEGISQSTLFRNYTQKFQEAQKIIHRLVQLEKKMTSKQPQNVSRRAVLWKLKSMKDTQNQGKISTVIQLLKKDANVLDIMGEAEFIEDAVNEYHNIHCQLIDAMNNFIYRMCIMKISQHRNNFNWSEKNSRVIANDSRAVDNQYKQSTDKQPSKQDDDQLQGKNTPSKIRKHNFASGFCLPNKHVSAFRSQVDRGNNHSPSPLNSSRLQVKPANNKNSSRNQVYKNEGEKEKKYKIGKDEPKKVNKIEKGREIAKEKNKNETSKQEQFEPIEINPMNQFIREVIPAKEVAQEPIVTLPLRQKEKQKPIEIIQQSQTHNIPVLKNTDKASKNPKQPVASPNVNNSHVSATEIKASKSSLNSIMPLGSDRFLLQKSSLKQNQAERFQAKLRKIINACVSGQYIQKRHFSSDGGAQRFLRLGHHKDKLYWGPNEQLFDQSSYNFQDIKGIVYGKITETMLKESNRKLEPWRCFSLIMKKRTFDVYCTDESDLKFWIPGLSLFLKEFKYDTEKYIAKSNCVKKSEKHTQKYIALGENVVTRYYSTGRLLWKKFLMRLQWQCLQTKKKEKRNVYSNSNAYAIIVSAVRKLKYKPVKISRHIQ